MNIVSLFLSGKLPQSIDDFTVLPLAIVNRLSGAHNSNISLTATVTDMIPVYEINVSKLTTVQDAILDGHGLAAAKEDGTQVAVGIHGGKVAALVNITAELSMDGTRMAIITLIHEIRNHFVPHIIWALPIQKSAPFYR